MSLSDGSCYTQHMVCTYMYIHVHACTCMHTSTNIKFYIISCELKVVEQVCKFMNGDVY